MEINIFTTSLIALVLLIGVRNVSSTPQKESITIPTLDFSPAQEINNLEPSAIPEIERRSFLNSGNYLEATVEEVQNILKSNPDLPRLTKGEILDLLENITKDDMEKLRNLNVNRNGKAILLVMPYSPKKQGENIEELYTKSPVTQMIDTENQTEIPETQKKVVRRKKPVYHQTKKDNFKPDPTRPSYKKTTAIPTTLSTPIATTAASTTIPTTPYRITTYRPRTRPPRTRSPTLQPSTSAKPFRRRRITKITTTSTTESANHEYIKRNPQEFRQPLSPVYKSSLRRTTTEKPDLTFAESYTNNIYVKYNPHDKNHPVFESKYTQSPPFKPMPSVEIISEEPAFTQRPSVEDAMIPEDFRYIMKDLQLDSTLQRESVLEDALKSATIFPKTTTSTTTEFPITPMPAFEEVADNLSPDMKDLLISFGLIQNPDENKNVPVVPIQDDSKRAKDDPESYTGFKPLPEDGETDKEMDALLASFGLGRSARSGRRLKKKINKNQQIDLSIIPESMKSVIENLGLKGEIEQSTSRVPLLTDRIDENENENDTISAEDIQQINDLSNEIQDEKPVENSTSLDQPLAEKYEDLDTEETKTENYDNETVETTKSATTSVVFNPTDQKMVAGEKNKLDNLMSLIKTLKKINGSATEEDFKDIDLETLKQFTEALNTSQRLTVGEQIADSQEINPVFIPEIPDNVEETTPSESLNLSETQQLEESFGGLNTGEDAVAETETPPVKKIRSGSYYLLDWNSFLDVDDTKGKRVNLRFQPKAGDPTRFYAITNN